MVYKEPQVKPESLEAFMANLQVNARVSSFYSNHTLKGKAIYSYCDYSMPTKDF